MSKKIPKKARASMAQNKLRSEGAEFLVLANLLIRDIQATKAYSNFPGWDVLAVNPKTGKQAKLCWMLPGISITGFMMPIRRMKRVLPTASR